MLLNHMTKWQNRLNIKNNLVLRRVIMENLKLYVHWVNCVLNCPNKHFCRNEGANCILNRYIRYNSIYDQAYERNRNCELVYYTKQVKCYKEDCPDGDIGKCFNAYRLYKEDVCDYPEDGLCYNPIFTRYEFVDDFNCYEKEKVYEDRVA
jgi:hypothetical protein